MSVTRTEALNVLVSYLDGKTARDVVHKWALNIVITKEFDKLISADQLLTEVIHALFDLHHEGDDERFNPTIEELEYYKNCLEGKIEFNKKNKT